MGYNLGKRIATIQQQSELDNVERVGLFRTLILCLLISWVVSSLFLARPRPSPTQRVLDPASAGFAERPVQNPAPASEGSFDSVIERLRGGEFPQEELYQPEVIPSVPAEISEDRVAVWLARTNATVQERAEWLRGMPGGSILRAQYVSTAEFMLKIILPTDVLVALQNREETLPILAEEDTRLGHTVVAGLIGASFVLIAMWPFWIIGGCAGFFFVRHGLQRKDVDPILSVCDRGRSPFYSGIYGPLRPGKKLSGTEFSCFGLACPKKVSQRDAFKHPAVDLLRRYGALTETALELCQVILAHRNYPGFVEEERPVEEENPHHDDAAGTNTPSLLIRPSEITIEHNIKQVLPGLLEAHQALVRVYRSIGPDTFHGRNDLRLAEPCAELVQLMQKMSKLGRLLVTVLTPARGYALAQLPAAHVVAAYLAIEAGKSLVFEPAEEGFTKTTPFPHLQARAVLHSVPAFHREFDGDSRLIIRQAILCSRRHGDFGRAFIPEGMPTSCRALRDWLEVLFANEEKREDAVLITELDAQADEIRENFQQNIVSYLRASSQQRSAEAEAQAAPSMDRRISKGIPHKSVVLVPRERVIEIALSGFSETRLERIAVHRRHARRFREALAVSARLPGFKRQMSDQEKHEEIIPGKSTSPEQRRAEERWMLVRMMLTRFNWLSTRVGDDAVPVDGVVFAMHDSGGNCAGKRSALPAMVPLRQRRFESLLGAEWEITYYADAFHPNEISTYVNKTDYDAALQGIDPAKLDAAAEDSGTTSPSASDG